MWWGIFTLILKKSGFKGKYTGVDISSEAIKLAKKNYLKNNNCNFILLNILKKNLKKFDYILINGTFNNNTKNNWIWMREILVRLFSITKKALIFNNLFHIMLIFMTINYFILSQKKYSIFVKKVRTKNYY